MTTSPPIAILHAPGTNRDLDAALAFERAGGAPEIVHINLLLTGGQRLSDYAMLVVPGGFSYGDDLGAGKLWAVRLLHDLGDQLHAFAGAGKPILGICNGFQVLVKTGLLPGPVLRAEDGGQRTEDGEQRTEDREQRTEDGGQRAESGGEALSGSQSAIRNSQSLDRHLQLATLTRNTSAHFECRWVWLKPNATNRSPWLTGLERIHCPVAHGEGNFMTRDAATLDGILAQNLVAFTYVDAEGRPGPYPVNPNGSTADIAGITNGAGNILGLMPHPENHIFPQQHPAYHGGVSGQTGNKLFQNGVAFARKD